MSITNQNEAITNAIEIHDLQKVYQDFTLDHLNLSLPQGCVMGLVGENGAGKSTTIKLIMNMIKRDGGKVTVLGRDNRKHFELTKEDIGVVLDEVGFPQCMTAKQVGKVMAHAYRNWDRELYSALLEKLSVPADKPFSDFSRGMKMKLGISVALSHHPKLLILDEATSGLDPVIREEVLDMFNEFTREENHSILMSSHIVSDLEKICDYIAFLHKGRLLLCEEKDVLLGEYGIIHCTPEQFKELDVSAVKGKKKSSYGIEVLVKRESIPEGIAVSPVSIEEIFLFMVKEER
ncbi:MAG: ABC transporter ATP-binding protein [Lachnospiraceae bacterium]|nr:ABC transporter ATP-binding protein [Lachnospiraceae bacterium]